MTRVFIGVGSNINPEANVHAALCALGCVVRITGVSHFYCTPPLRGEEQPPFYNGVVEIETELPPHELKFDVLREIERDLGRRRNEDKYAARTIDLDILLYDDLVLQTEELQIPDPEIAARSFLAIPLCELDADLVLPDSGRQIREIARQFQETLQPLLALTALLREDCLHEQKTC